MAVPFSVQGKGSEVGTDDGDKLLANMVLYDGKCFDDVVYMLIIIRPNKRSKECLCLCLWLCW